MAGWLAGPVSQPPGPQGVQIHNGPSPHLLSLLRYIYTMGMEMFAETKVPLFSRLMCDCENIICENYNSYSTVTNLVLHCTYTHSE